MHIFEERECGFLRGLFSRLNGRQPYLQRSELVPEINLYNFPVMYVSQRLQGIYENGQVRGIKGLFGIGRYNGKTDVTYYDIDDFSDTKLEGRAADIVVKAAKKVSPEVFK